MVEEQSTNETSAINEAPTTEPVVSPIKVNNNPNLKWYIVHTYTGFENQAKIALIRKIEFLQKEEYFGEILIPTEQVIETTKTGVKRRTQKKFFPSYMLIQMELNDETWHIVRDTPKVTGFVGDKKRPPSIPQREVDKLTKGLSEGTMTVQPTVEFREGETVRITGGSFVDFAGTIENVNEDKKKLRVLISILGKSTPVELEFNQVEKT